jgi:hypothetical protein
MKQFRFFLRTACVALLVALISSTSFAQDYVISTKYSDKEIATLIQNYKNTHNRDVRVDGVLLQKFRQDFPNARDVDWETNDEIYEVEFEIKDRDFEAYYDKDGNLLLYKQDIHERELPAVVKKSAEAKYPKYRFDDIDKIVKGTQTFYKIEMELRGHDITIYIASDGKTLEIIPVH